MTANFFDVLGIHDRPRPRSPPEDDVPGAPAVAVISHAYWLGRFAADPAVVGRQVQINAQPFTIVGVTQQAFAGGESGLRFDLWVPVGATPLVMPGGNRLEAPGIRWLKLLARLKPGVSVDQARAELESTVSALRAGTRGRRDIDHGVVYPMSDSPTGGVAVLRPVLLILMAVAGIVLLIACANLAGLLLARASARRREIAIRLSMGARRSRIIQQLLVEGAVLSALGAAAAMVAVQWTSGLLIGFAPPSELPIFLDVTVDNRVLGFTAAVAVLHDAAVCAGTGPQASTADLAPDTAGCGHRGPRLRASSAASRAGRGAGRTVDHAAGRRGPVHAQPRTRRRA